MVRSVTDTISKHFAFTRNLHGSKMIKKNLTTEDTELHGGEREEGKKNGARGSAVMARLRLTERRGRMGITTIPSHQNNSQRD